MQPPFFVELGGSPYLFSRVYLLKNGISIVVRVRNVKNKNN
jgi:hypothetical protein